MDFRQDIKASSGKPIGAVLVALIAGGALPFVALLQVSLLVPVLMLGGILAAYFGARHGWLPMGALIVAAAVSSAWFLGLQIALMVLATSLAPALPVSRGVARKAPFFSQLRGGIVAYVAGLLAGMLIASASFGSGMIARFVDMLRAEYDQMPDAALMPLVEWMNALLSSGGANQSVTVDTFRGQLAAVLDLMQQTYAQTLPGTLLSGALLSGVLSVLWGNWAMARRGMATNESFVGMSRWYLPAQVSLGAVFLWLAGIVLLYGGYESGATVYMTIGQTAGAIFAIQALCALDRRMLASGRSLPRRRALIALLAVLSLLFRGIGSVLGYVGVASALFGSRGAIRLWLQRRKGDDSNHDDSDE